MTFTVTVTNAGPAAATGIEVTDVLPVGLTFVRAVPTIGAYDDATGVWVVGDLAPGSSAHLDLTAAVDQPGSHTNMAMKTAQGEPDPVLSNDASGVTLNGPFADVQVVKTVDNSTPQLGQRVTFTVQVTNNGPDTATGVEITDVLPSGLTLVCALPSQGAYTRATGVWTIGTLAESGAGATVALQLEASVNQPGLLTNLATRIA